MRICKFLLFCALAFNFVDVQSMEQRKQEIAQARQNLDKAAKHLEELIRQEELSLSEPVSYDKVVNVTDINTQTDLIQKRDATTQANERTPRNHHHDHVSTRYHKTENTRHPVTRATDRGMKQKALLDTTNHPHPNPQGDTGSVFRVIPKK